MTRNSAKPPLHPRRGSAGLRSPAAGCAWGCLGAFVVIGLVLLIGWHQVKRSLNAAPHPAVVLSEEEAQVLEEKIATVEEGDALEERTLRFSEKELNAWISRDPELADTLRIELEPNELSLEIRFESPFDEGKLMSARASVQVLHSGNDLQLRLTKLKLGGFRIPKVLLGDLARENLAEKFLEGDRAETFFQAVESIRITEDDFILVAEE